MVGVLLYIALIHNLPFYAQVISMGILILLAIVVCDEAERRMLKRDPGEVIIDEVVAQPLVFLGLPSAVLGTWWAIGVLVLGFGLFRLFDIWKPLIINRLQFLPGGVGVVADDLAAAAAAWLVLQMGLWGLLRSGWLG